jgi:GT2 family glycosyltransferase
VLLPVIVRLFRTARLAAGCFLFCTRSAFVSVGGFDETFFGAEEVIISRALKRQGRFVILRQAVRTSGRKMRTHSAGEVLLVMFRMALRGTKAVRQREGMELWYAERREDPQGDA